MSTEEILKQVRKIEIDSKWFSSHTFAGKYRTAFKGTGVKFKEVREYQPGDDVRFIEWNVSARMGHPYVEVFEEERELPVYILVDVSASTIFGTSKQSKKDLILKLSADISFSATSNNDKVGIVFFSDKIEKYIPPKRNKEHVRYIIEQLITLKPISAKTNIGKALEFVTNISKHGSIIFIISDFVDDEYSNALGNAVRRHDVIGLKIYDRSDVSLPAVGLIEIKDTETGNRLMLNTSNEDTSRKYREQFLQIQNRTTNIFKQAGAGLLHFETGIDPIQRLQQFFLQRSK